MNEFLDLLGSIWRYIYVYFIDHITSILGLPFGMVFVFPWVGHERIKSRFGRLLKVWSLIQGHLSRFEHTYYLRHDSTHTVPHVWSGYISLGDDPTPPGLGAEACM